MESSAHFSLTPVERRFVRRSGIVIAAGAVLFAYFAHVHRTYDATFHRTTGEAVWIWPEHRLASDEPVAFFASTNFEAPAARRFGRLRISGQPLYTVWLNGRLIGGSRDPSGSLDSYDVTEHLVDGVNRLVLAIRSERGVGGVLTAVDFAPMMRNAIVSGSDWEIERRWRNDLLLRPAADSERPVVIGSPPIGPWNYPPERETALLTEELPSLSPRAVTDIDTTLPEIRVLSGVAVAGSRPARARLFDFGSTRRGMLRLRRPSGDQELVRLGFLTLEEDLAERLAIEGLVLAAGEEEAIDPRLRTFRYVVVYESEAMVELISM